jgi:hypothetical protein
MTFAERREHLFDIAGLPRPVVHHQEHHDARGSGAYKAWRSCGRKVRFNDENEAARHAKRFDQRHYQCDECGGYHCTKILARSRPVR